MIVVCLFACVFFFHSLQLSLARTHNRFLFFPFFRNLIPFVSLPDDRIFNYATVLPLHIFSFSLLLSVHCGRAEWGRSKEKSKRKAITNHNVS